MDLCHLTELLEDILHQLNLVAPHCSWLQVQEHLGWCQNLQGHPPTAGTPSATPFAHPKHQVVQAVHVKVAKEHESIATPFLHRAL